MGVLRVLRTELIVLLTLVGVGGLVGWIGAGTPASVEEGYTVIASDDLEPFRSSFNESSDHVRLVLLVGPT